MRIRVLVFVALLVGITGSSWGLDHPMPVSPGAGDRYVSTATRCPTFSWAASQGAEGYELAVVRVHEEGGPTETVLQQSFVGMVTSWTPALDLCFTRGERYAWSVRALDAHGVSEWSSPNLFDVSGTPTDEEFHEALDVVRRYLDGDQRTDAPPSEGRYVQEAAGTDTDAGTSPASQTPDRATGLKAGGLAAYFGGTIAVSTSGRIGIRESAPAADLHITQSDGLIGGTGGAIFSRSTDWKILHTGSHFSFVENNVRRAYVETGTGAYVQVSDAALKQDVVDLGCVLNRVLELRPVRYHIAGAERGPQAMGFIAQDLGEVFPELMRTDEEGQHGLSYSELSVLAIAAIQEQQQAIEALREDNSRLRTELRRSIPEVDLPSERGDSGGTADGRSAME